MKPIYQYTKNYYLVKKWNTMNEILKKNKSYNEKDIINNLNGLTKRSYNHIWSYDEKLGKTKKIIYQYDLSCNLIKKWNSIKDIIKEHPKYNRGPLSHNLSEMTKSSYGYVWTYKSDFSTPVRDIVIINKKYILKTDVFDYPNDDEYWKNITGYEGRYLISNHGRVYSLLTQIILAQNIQNKTSYPDINLKDKNQTEKTWSVHTLVGVHFIKNTNKKYNMINHIDHKKNNNHYKNLEWTDASGNGLAYHKQKPPRAIDQYNLDNKLIKEWTGIDEILKDNKSYKRKSILRCLFGEYKKIYNSIWKYKNPKKQKEIIEYKNEIWKNIGVIDELDFSRYDISNYGQIRLNKSMKILSPSINENGYYHILLTYKKNKRKNYYIHTLVAYMFCNKPDNYRDLVVNHIDENKVNNHFKNLEWITQKMNVVHSVGIKINQINIKTNEIINIFDCIKDAARSLGKKHGSDISQVCNGKKRMAYGFKWKYAK